MEARQLVMVTSFTKNRRKSLIQMKQLGLMQKALAERMNCTQQYISKILKGKENMSLDRLSKLEKALGITLILDEEYDNLPIGMVAEDAPPYSR